MRRGRRIIRIRTRLLRKRRRRKEVLERTTEHLEAFLASVCLVRLDLEHLFRTSFLGSFYVAMMER